MFMNGRAAAPPDMLHLCSRRPKQRVYTLKIKICHICIFAPFVKTTALCATLNKFIKWTCKSRSFCFGVIVLYGRLCDQNVESFRRQGPFALGLLYCLSCSGWDDAEPLRMHWKLMFIKQREEAKTWLELMTFVNVKYIFRESITSLNCLLCGGFDISSGILGTLFHGQNNYSSWGYF